MRGWPWNLTDDLENNRAPPLWCFKLCASFYSHQWIQTGVRVRKHQIWVKIDDFFSRVTLKFDGWPWKTTGHIFYDASSLVHHFLTISEFKLELQPGNTQFGSKSAIFSRVTMKFDAWPKKNNRAPLLSNIKLCASFHHHMRIQTGVMVRKRLSGVLTSVTLTFDLWLWPFAWTSLSSLEITPKNFMMIRWWEQSQKGVTDRDGQTDRQTDWTIHRAAWSQLKNDPNSS